ncbi:MMS19 nucleotide excision repair protein homolog isoform X2 [Chenopodium quinoa]|uniref:MMS19 nucleotide excision repair protein homolog isoform X2 n=1 Tax=Chenopodium quinoa TaxID=63459 RepID=UPI000B77E1C7|nr:MMS19 nucleotide excision repair protein homolog isoform X2 [Chenopodium quinoa]
MEPHTSLIKQIESFVDSSATPAQQIACVKSIASLLKNDSITMEFLVKEMELYLTTTDHILRARGILLLAEVLGHLQTKPLDRTTIHTLVGFFSERLADWRALRGALVGCLALVRRKINAGVVTGTDAKILTQSFLENVQVQSLGQHDRKLCFELLEDLLNRYPGSISALGDHVVYGVCEAIEGEKDPQCLMHVFHIVEGLARVFPDPSGPVANFAEDFFDIIGRYFPIHYTHPKSEDVDISREDLSRALMMAFSASPFFEPFAIPLLLEKLSSNLPLAKIDSLKYLSDCTVKYGPDRIAKHAEAIWNSLKAAICNLPRGPSEDVSSFASDLSNGMIFEENEITKEALNLLQKVASQQNSGFLNLVLKDRDINNLINSFTASGSSDSIPPQNEQELCFVGRIFSVLAKASTSSCNAVFDTLFLRLLDNLRVPADNDKKNVLAIDSDSPYQKLNFSALYLCVEILGACRELAVASVQVSSSSNFVNDAWCQKLIGCSSSLMKTMVSDLVPSTNEIYNEAYISIKVKSLQILATFPGDSAPVSKSLFENIVVTLVSIVTNNFDVTALWKASINALTEIGTFLNDFHYSEKLLSFMSTAVERMIVLISLDDSTMPYSLLLEALSKISASGYTFLLRNVQEWQEAMSAKFAKVYVDGDVKVSAELVQLLDCYSKNLLPRFQLCEGSEIVPFRLAIDVWDQIEAAMGSGFFVKGKLLDATKVALKLAVATLSEENQWRIIEKAVKVISFHLSFSPNFVPSKLKELQISEDSDGFSCRDEWLTTLFASVIISLRPKTQITNIRAVIESLLTAFINGHVTSAQALGSIVNKMSLTKEDMQDSSYFNLDDVLTLILERSLGSCSDLFLSSSSEMCDSDELRSKLAADCILPQARCISGLAWIGKGLLMRGHEKLKDITMIFVRCLVFSSVLEALAENIGGLEREGVQQSLARSAADAFHVLMSDSEDCLNKTFHAAIRPLYKQRFFSTVMPILLSAAKKTHSHTVRSMLYRAIGHVITNTPLAAILSETKKLLPLLLDVISVLSEDILNKDMIYNLLLVLSGLLMDKFGQDTAVENVHVIINCLTGLVSYPHKMVVRETAIQCLVAVSGMPHTRIYPMRLQVLRALSKVLDDPKRSVRQEAVRCRQAWSSFA